ncbi:Di-copper centre-containing protein [Aureobasidium pullulans]|nr:Di-copper centre-containing protein [Aureobasidium pullulans]
MKTTSILAVAALLASAHASPHDPLPKSASSDTSTAQEQLKILVSHATYAVKSHKKPFSSTCKPGNVQVRKEWSTLSPRERITYTDAVLCLQNKAAKSPASWAPGAKSRYDDWVATHIDQTLRIHYTGNFLGWHRYFLWEYEQALRNECGYQGTQPYWNWGLSAASGMEKSPVWDGSKTSMSGNGAHIDQTNLSVVLGGNGLPEIYLPVGTGGGCITSGPFQNMTVNLGPAALTVPGNITSISPSGPLSYNPRCLKRDLTDEINTRFANSTAIVDNILSPQNVYDFQMQMQGIPGTGIIGIHGGGHYAMGGDPGRDVFTSPGDPAFYLHHSMIDLVWTTWQMLDPENRIYGKDAIMGTNTFLNIPASENTTRETNISIGWAGRGKNVTMGDVMSTVEGPFCYVYA